jgi:hypothetical protein
LDSAVRVLEHFWTTRSAETAESNVGLATDAANRCTLAPARNLPELRESNGLKGWFCPISSGPISCFFQRSNWLADFEEWVLWLLRNG